MWDHLAGSLIGENINQTFNIYLGNGSNGKSKITKLMSLVLGDYYGTVPIALITERRNGIGGTSSEVMNLKGVRYAVMQEPTKEVVLNDGVMKELTGGDPIVGRQLYKEAESFIPQFDLCVCTNILPLINSNDDGTWRRMKLVDFLSKFVSDGEQHTDDTKHVFPKDKSLKEKLPSVEDFRNRNQGQSDEVMSVIVYYDVLSMMERLLQNEGYYMCRCIIYKYIIYLIYIVYIIYIVYVIYMYNIIQIFGMDNSGSVYY
jgi:hypothetical protein